MRLADLDAVTLDAYGTLLELADPVPALRAALAEHGIERDERQVRDAFAAEVAHYVPRSHEGRDAESLRALRLDCAAVFLRAAGAGLDPAAFLGAFVGALRFEPVAGARDAVAGLQRRGLALAVVANWDCALPEHLEAAGLGSIPVVVTSAEAGAAKPDARPFELALERLGVRPERALHVGDSEADELGAAAAGLRFAPAPLADRLAGAA